MNPKKDSLLRRLSPAVALTGASVLGIVVLDRAAGSSQTDGLAEGPADSVADVDNRTPVTVGSTAPPSVVPETPPSGDEWGERRDDDFDDDDFDEGFGPNGDEGAMNPPGASGFTGTTTAPDPDCVGTTTRGSVEPIKDRRRTYGTLTVSITKDARGTICDVSASYNVRDRRSLRIEEYAVPRLNAWAQESNGASVHAISGATAVCDAYVASLQAALDAVPGP